MGLSLIFFSMRSVRCFQWAIATKTSFWQTRLGDNEHFHQSFYRKRSSSQHHWIFIEIFIASSCFSLPFFCVVESSLFTRVSSILSDKLNISRKEHHENSHETELLHSMFVLVMISKYFPLLLPSFVLVCSFIRFWDVEPSGGWKKTFTRSDVVQSTPLLLTIHPLILPFKSVQLFFNSFATAGKYANERELLFF